MLTVLTLSPSPSPSPTPLSHPSSLIFSLSVTRSAVSALLLLSAGHRGVDLKGARGSWCRDVEVGGSG
jgi:hypothetical protein